MVACDGCGTWFHFTCAGVQASICNKPWHCGYCSTQGDNQSSSAISVGSGSSSARLRLRQLEESKALDDRLLLQQAEKERAFLAEKHRLEAEIQCERQLKGSTSSFRSRLSRRSHRSEIRTWINQSMETPPTVVTQQAGASTSTPVVSSGNVIQAVKDMRLTQPVQSIPQGNHQEVVQKIVVPPPPTNTNIVQATIALPLGTELKTSVAPIITNAIYPPKQPIPAPHHDTLRRDQQKQHPPGPPKQALPPTSQSGQLEVALPGMNLTVGKSVPAASHLEDRKQEKALDRHQQTHLYNQRDGQLKGYSLQPAGNHNATSLNAPLPPAQWHSSANISSMHNQQQFHKINQNPIAPSINTFYPMNFYPPQYYTRMSTGASPAWMHQHTANQLSGATEANETVPQVYAATAQHDRQQNIQQNIQQPLPGQASGIYFTPATEGVLSAQQLAARQVVSRELPKFSGDPLEWPMFINAFESTTAMCGIQPDENLARLQKSLVGGAREKVQSILTLPAAIPEIIQTLRDECGRPEQLVHCLLEKIRHAAPPNVNKLDTLINFGREVKNLVIFIEGARLQDHLSNPMLLSELVGKLPPSLRLEWGLHTQKVPQITLKAFSDYVTAIKSAACKVSLPSDCLQEENRRGRKEKGGFVNAHSVEEKSTIASSSKKEYQAKFENIAPKPCPACNRNDHKLRNCGKFKGFNMDQRKRIVEQSKLCQRCLGSHGKWPCRTKQSCEVDGCNEFHHSLLHSPNPKQASPVLPTGSSGVISAHCPRKAGVLFKVLPVVLSNHGKSVSTYAFLDDGSNLTLMEEEVAEELGLNGNISPLCIQWTGSVTRNEPTSRQVELRISNAHGGREYTISEVQTVPRLDLPQQSLDYAELSKQFPHLKGLPVSSFSNAVPRILIGLDNATLKLTLDKRERRSSEPVAAKTRLGWTIFGGGQRGVKRSDRVMFHMCDCTVDDTLHRLVNNYFDVENMGTKPVTSLESPEDQRARQILMQTTRRTESGRFECGLLWKCDTIEFPESYAMAERRLVCLEKKLGKDQELKRKVLEQIEEYLERGYAHKATEEELRNSDQLRVWYLPLGIVRNPRKPEKVRIVWDAAARVGDVSLNSMLLSGPDLLTPLLKVMFQFRQRQYVAVGDVRQMFHQLLVRQTDRQVQRFLFRSEPEQAPTVYVMDVVIFGASCSPCLAQYVKNTNAREFEELYPEATLAIINNTYVDDFLDSKDTVDETVQIVEEVRLIFDKAGFEIRNWQSNSEEVLRRVGVDFMETTKRFAAEKSTVAERVLGMEWIPKVDSFVFSTQFREDLQPLLTGSIVPTKRQVLRVVMSHFDPLGIVAFYTVHGKILIQDMWRSGIKWDDPITVQNFESWQRWVKLIPNLMEIQMPRCYFPKYNLGSYDTLELHVFVDASLMAYCAVAYFRIIDNGTPRCALVAAKTKVTPLKPQSIPRSELCAGVIGVRLLKSIQENHSIPIQKRYMWTDSTTVLAWLRSDPRKYQQFVAFRVAEIQSETSIDEWAHVPSNLNPADKGTKWGNGPCFDPENSWFTGSTFLHRLKHEWPRQPTTFTDPQQEVKAIHHHAAVCDSTIDFTNFSRWEDLLKRLAYVYHFVHSCQKRRRKSTGCRIVILEQRDFEAAEASVWRFVQRQAFAYEIDVIRKNSELSEENKKSLKRSSEIGKLSAYLDDKGVLRMQSRINTDVAYYSFDFVNPVIVPRKTHVTNLLIHKYHQRYGHANVETVVNELRQRYYIPKNRCMVKNVVKQCVWCKVYRAKPIAPRMAMLPHPRVRPYVRPLTFTGLDYFGPLTVKRGRTIEKRWVALFTCLTIRAVHVEVVHSLSADSCKMAIRRFVARRGAPQQIYSDNGTNFRGAARELAVEIKTINRKLASTFTNAETEWVFNPPSAPHMGGVWERKVRSIKDAFKSLHHARHLNDEELMTFMAEAEIIVNSHPLTFIPLEHSSDEAITPNNFILMSSSGANTTSRISVNEDFPLRVNWKMMQQLLNQFWKRWIQGYLPTIARRTKWFSDVRPLQNGDPVVIVDETVRNGWLRGRITKIYPAKDGQVRKVDVQTSSGVLQRPTIKVALLDIIESKTIQDEGITGRGVAKCGY
ncbi:uncharacterized protein LOC131687160 [Topomyia yanbarensis]|uniref:uncharacterized protein LOC131687160 n=1 Tax=Topomyia yanbarensis TaxID=2498891 RepID=UPI00273AA9DB|nr:uncharacterized protein LOC131687160 [Topomyia yanbarensis]